ncbi:MAG TPA: hypothetical protein VGQ83_37265 [Polyangia bacterium]|jgi:hypothetical protein
MKKLAAFVLGGIVLLGSSAAFAQRELISPGRLFYDKRPTIYTYEEDEITVDILGPGEEIIDLRLGSVFGTLVQPRHDFNAEMLKDAENL